MNRRFLARAVAIYPQIYSMAVQIVGVSWYGYIVGTWASVLNSFDREDKEQRRCGAMRCNAVLCVVSVVACIPCSLVRAHGISIWIGVIFEENGASLLSSLSPMFESAARPSHGPCLSFNFFFLA